MGSTTSGTCSRARPAPATAPVQVARWSARGCEAGSLLKLRTGRGVWHAEGIGDDELAGGQGRHEMRGVLFWVNLARKDKGVEPSAQLLQSAGGARPAGGRRDRPGAGRGGLSGRTRDSWAHPGRRVAGGRSFTSPVPPDFNGFVYMLEGEASFGANQTAGEPLADCRSRSGWRADGGRCAARDAVHAHGREAAEASCLQRTIRRLMDLSGACHEYREALRTSEGA